MREQNKIRSDRFRRLEIELRVTSPIDDESEEMAGEEVATQAFKAIVGLLNTDHPIFSQFRILRKTQFYSELPSKTEEWRLCVYADIKPK